MLLKFIKKQYYIKFIFSLNFCFRINIKKILFLENKIIYINLKIKYFFILYYCFMLFFFIHSFINFKLKIKINIKFNNLNIVESNYFEIIYILNDKHIKK